MPEASLDVKVVSALRAAGSTSAIRALSEDMFTDDVAKNGFIFLRDHVLQHRTFPTPAMIRQASGLVTVRTTQPSAYYTDELRNRALYYQLVPDYGEMQEAMSNLDPTKVVEIARNMARRAATLQASANDYTPVTSALEMVRQDYDIARMTSGLRGVPTYWPFLNEITAGWQNDDLITIVGRPGMGKTYIILLQAYAAWRAGYSVLFVSMELGALQLARRLFGIHSKINPDLIRRGRISTQMHENVVAAMSGMDNGVPFNIVVGGFKKSITTVRAIAEATEPDMVFVDASYLLKPEAIRKGADTRREKVSDTIEGLKTLALDLQRPVAQSVQFNRTVTPPRRTPKRGDEKSDETSDEQNPVAYLTLEGIGETDIIGQASSIVVGLAKPAFPYADVQRWLALIKGREGEQGIFKINYKYNPVNFDLLQVGPDPRRADRRLNLPNISHME